MSDEMLVWTLGTCLLGIYVCSVALARLMRLITLLRNSQTLRLGPAEIFGEIAISGPPLVNPTGAALILRHRQAFLAADEDNAEVELASQSELQAALCVLRTRWGAAVLDCKDSLCDLESGRKETRALTTAELAVEPNAQLVRQAKAAAVGSRGRDIIYKLTETIVLDRDPVLVLADMAELPTSGADPMAPRWQLSGRPGSPLVIREGRRWELIGDALWLAALGGFGSLCLYYGWMLFLGMYAAYQL